MAVYTSVPAEALEAFLARYDVGTLLSAKGIAEGVSNSNFLVETDRQRFILTLYEHRIALGDLPWFVGLMEHLADRGLPVPRPIRDRAGDAIQSLEARAACLIQYLPGVSVTRPTVAQARAVGEALARLHGAGWDRERPNGLGPDWWQETATALGDRLDTLEPGLHAFVCDQLALVTRRWPRDLPRGTVHADLFPDNVLMLGAEVTGLIDFYFACTDFLAYDLAVLHSAWAYPPDGATLLPAHEAALMAGYEAVRPLTPAERAAWPVLVRGAALRFLLSRAEDWFRTAPDALVTRKDPLPFARRLRQHAALA